MGVVVLASGGVDSSVLLKRAHQDPSLGLAGVVFCNYGQPAALREWLALQAILSHLGWTGGVHEVALTTMSAKPMQEVGSAGPRVVPVRNLIMLAHAANYAESIGARGLWYGPTRDYWDSYWDCHPLFLHHAQQAIGPYVRLDAPLAHLWKHQVLAEAADAGLLEHTWSCYEGGEAPCGGCASCGLRARMKACHS